MRVNVTLGYTRYITLDRSGTGNSQNPFNSPNQQSALDPTTNQQVLVSGVHHCTLEATLLSQLNNNFYNASTDWISIFSQ